MPVPGRRSRSAELESQPDRVLQIVIRLRKIHQVSEIGPQGDQMIENKILDPDSVIEQEVIPLGPGIRVGIDTAQSDGQIRNQFFFRLKMIECLQAVRLDLGIGCRGIFGVGISARVDPFDGPVLAEIVAEPESPETGGIQ